MRKERVLSEAGDSVSWRKTEVLATGETYALCRCGRSGSKPFCDGSHARVELIADRVWHSRSQLDHFTFGRCVFGKPSGTGKADWLCFAENQAEPLTSDFAPLQPTALSIWPASHGGWPSVHKVSGASASQPILRQWIERSPIARSWRRSPRLLRERGLSIRALARAVGVTDGHLSRVMRCVNYKTPGPELARRVATALGLPPDYFPEYRKGFVLERIRTDAVLCDELYAKLTGEKA